MAKKTSAEYPEGRPGYGEVKPRDIIRKDGTTYRVWLGCYKGPEGTRQYVSDEKKKEAQELLRKSEAKIRKGANPKDGKIAWDKAFEVWLDEKEDAYAAGVIYGNTIDNCRWAAKHLPKAFGKTPIRDLTRKDIQAWAHRMLATEYKPGKKYKPHSVDNLRSFVLQVLEDTGGAEKLCQELRKNPIKIYSNKRQKRRVDIPDPEQIDRLIAFLDGPKPDWMQQMAWGNRKAIVGLGLGAGMRPGEIAALHTKSLNLPRRTMEVLPDKGSLARREGLKAPKSDAGIRDIPINRYTWGVLTSHFLDYGTDGFVIKNRQADSEPLSVGKVSKHFSDLMRAAEMTKEDGHTPLFTLHALRHFHVSARLELGHNVLEIVDNIGHEDAATTLGTYGHRLTGKLDAPIWRERFSPSDPSEAGQDRLAIEGAQPGRAPKKLGCPWVADAVRLLETGVRVREVARQLGRDTSTMSDAFKAQGLPPPIQVRKLAREKRFQELYDKGYGDVEIAKLTNVSSGSVFHWRYTMEHGVPNTRRALADLRTDLQQKGDKGD